MHSTIPIRNKRKLCQINHNNKTKPIRIEEFEAEKAWWGKRVESEHAWRVPVEQIVESGYNLDIKNPNTVVEGNGDPEVLLAAYRKTLDEVAEVRDRLKTELMDALGGKT